MQVQCRLSRILLSPLPLSWAFRVTFNVYNTKNWKAKSIIIPANLFSLNGLQRAASQPHARPMDFTGRPMKGFVYVDSKGWSKYATLKKWLDMGADCTSSLRRKLWAEALLCDVDSAARHDGKVILTLGDYVNWVSKRILHNLLNTKDHRI